MLNSPTSTTLRGLVKRSKFGECCSLFSDTLPLWHPYRSPGRTEALPYNLTDYFCCVLDPKHREMKHNCFVGYEAGEEQTCASGMAGRQRPELGSSSEISDFMPRYGVVHSPVNCRIASHCIFLQLKWGWYQLRDPWGERAPKLNKYCWL